MKFNISHREKEVINLLSLGLTAKEIGRRLYISHHTVIDHRKKILTKMGCSNGPAIVRKAFELGLLPLKNNEQNMAVI